MQRCGGEYARGTFSDCKSDLIAFPRALGIHQWAISTKLTRSGLHFRKNPLVTSWETEGLQQEAGGLDAGQVIQEQRWDLNQGAAKGRSKGDRDRREDTWLIAKYSV